MSFQASINTLKGRAVMMERSVEEDVAEISRSEAKIDTLRGNIVDYRKAIADTYAAIALLEGQPSTDTAHSRTPYFSDLLKVKKLFLPLVDFDGSKVMVRQRSDDPESVEVRIGRADGEELYVMRIVEASPLDPSEYHQHHGGYMHLWEDVGNSCPDHHAHKELT